MPSDSEDDNGRDPSTGLAVPPEVKEMYERYRTGRYAEALALAEDALVRNPSDSLAWAIHSACTMELGKASDGAVDAVTDLDASTSPDIATESNEQRREMYRRFLQSDYSAALELAEEALEARLDDSMAQAIRDESRIALTLRSSIPAVRGNVELAGDTDPQAAAMFARIDGIATVGQIVDETGVPAADAQRLFEEFAAAGIIDLWEPVNDPA